MNKKSKLNYSEKLKELEELEKKIKEVITAAKDDLDLLIDDSKK